MKKLVLTWLALLLSASVAQAQSIWISKAEIMARPMSGSAWTGLKAAADRACGTPNLADQNNQVNVCVFAKALVFARTGTESYRTAVKTALTSIANAGNFTGDALALGRELGAYAIAADLIQLESHDPSLHTKLVAKLKYLRNAPTLTTGPKSVVLCHEERPNNWGTHCGASRIAVDLYIKDQTDLNRAIQVFKGWLGDRSVYDDFKYGSLTWQANSTQPVGINPKGSVKSGRNIDGVLPDDQRRSGNFTWPPPKANYVYEALQGVVAQAVMLKNAGHDPFNWSDKAILRAVQWLHDHPKYPADGDDRWIPHIINWAYGTSFPAPSPTTPGKWIGYADFTHPKGAVSPPPVVTPPPPPPTPTPTPVPPVSATEALIKKLSTQRATQPYNGNVVLTQAELDLILAGLKK